MTRRTAPALGFLAVMALAVAVALLAAACGTIGTPVPGPPGTAPETGPETATASARAVVRADGGHNDTDVMWLQMMIAHHGQGLELVRLAADRATREEVRVLAGAVEATQADEVAMMTSWLTAWGESTALDSSPALHSDHGGVPVTGPEEIADLAVTGGAAFDTAFLNLFVVHQHNAVEMSALATDDGENTEVIALAGRIRESRTDQIQQMLVLLNS